MRTRYRLAAIVALILTLGLAERTSAKNWTWYISSTDVVSGSPGYIDVVIAIKANTSGDIGKLGNFTIRGTMSSSAIYDFANEHDPALQTEHLAGNYTVTVTNATGTNNWQLNGFLNSVGSGDQVPLLGILVATVRFYISDPSGTSNITLGSLQQTYEDDNLTPTTVTYDNTGGDVPLPIQMASFTASVVRDNDVEVAWKTVSETNNYGFEVYRKRNENGEWKELGFIKGNGTTLAEHSYTYLDKSVGFGQYYYQIKQIDLDGKSETFPEMNVVVGVAPDQFLLAQNYPNPFNPTTTIEFALPKETHVSLEVYNVIGQRVATLVDETKPTGIYVVPFNASALASGTYFYRLTTKEVSFIKKMMILR
jgi:hypothetical protein